MKQQQSHQLLQKVISLWTNQGGINFDELYCSDVHGFVNGIPISSVDIKHRLSVVSKHYEKLRYDVTRIVAEDDFMAYYSLYSAHNKKNNITYKAIPTSIFYQLRDGKISEVIITTPAQFDYFETA